MRNLHNLDHEPSAGGNISTPSFKVARRQLFPDDLSFFVTGLKMFTLKPGDSPDIPHLSIMCGKT